MQSTATLHSITAVPRAAGRMVSASRTTGAAQPVTNCETCNLRDLCLPCGLDAVDLLRMDELVFARRRIKSGEHIYRSGDGFAALYAVRTGFFKSSLTREGGEQQVTGFAMAGDVMGMDGIESERHTCDTAT